MNKTSENRDIEQDALIECLKPKKLIISDGDELLECPCAKNNIKPKTNFDKITSSVENLAEFINNYYWCPYFCYSTCDSEMDCKKCIKEWLQKECEG